MRNISVIMPTYNHARYIRGALESIFKQTYGDFEVVVVDDGSTDETKEIVESFGDSARYIYQDHQGRGSARERGVAESRGEWIAFLDSDDKWFPEKLKRQVSYIRKNNFSGLLHARARVIDNYGNEVPAENNRLNKLYSHGIKHNFSYESLLFTCPIFLSASMLPKKLIPEAGGFKKAYRVLEDFAFLLRLAGNTEIKFIDEPLVYYRKHPGNASSALKKEVEKTYLKIFNERLRDLNKIGEAKTRKIAEKYIYNNLVNFSYESGDRRAAFTYLKEFLTRQPLQLLNIKEAAKLLKLLTLSRPS